MLPVAASLEKASERLRENIFFACYTEIRLGPWDVENVISLLEIQAREKTF